LSSPPCPQRVQPIDFSHAGELIDEALADSRTFLDWLEHHDPKQAFALSAARPVPHAHA
jgi:hypothetical protein